MADISTLARPYAKAAFELARDKGAFDQWQHALAALAEVARQEEVQILLKDPRVSTAQQVDVFIAAAGDALDQNAKNFVKVLAQYRRLEVLPEIEADFTQLRAIAENTVQAELRTAVEASDAQRQKIRAALKQRLGRDIELRCVVDESLIGGAQIRAGDLVIDSSVSGKLERLANNVAH
ncbi:MAG TPA: F0F1 ATP synthase subunit delta [Gammaproteobacteria bacterium]